MESIRNDQAKYSVVKTLERHLYRMLMNGKDYILLTRDAR